MPSDIFRAGSTARLSETGVLDRCEAVPKLVGNAQDFLIIAGLAGTAKDVAHLCEPHANYYACAGVMGGATAMGLGLALAQPTVSHHLKRLTEAGLLEREQRGRWAYFSLRREALARLADMIELEEVAA